MTIHQQIVEGKKTAAELRKMRDLAAIDAAFEKLVADSPAVMAEILQKLSDGGSNDLSCGDPRLSFSLSCPDASPVQTGHLAAMPGYRKLFDYCASPEVDVKMQIKLESPAGVIVRLYPDRPFRDSIVHSGSEPSPAAVPAPEGRSFYDPIRDYVADKKPGYVMPDKTIYAGTSAGPHGGPVFTLPADEPEALRFADAVKLTWGGARHGHPDWRLPFDNELTLLFNNRAAIPGLGTGIDVPEQRYWTAWQPDQRANMSKAVGEDGLSPTPGETRLRVRLVRTNEADWDDEKFQIRLAIHDGVPIARETPPQHPPQKKKRIFGLF